MTTNLHDWAMFITPRELRVAMAAHRLDCREIVGINPQGNPLRAFAAFVQLKRGAITYAKIGERLPMVMSKRTPIQYAGYAIKAATEQARRVALSSHPVARTMG